MKTSALFACLLISLNTLSAATDVENGQTVAQVLEALGDPIGTIELREKTLFLYPQGEITLKEGQVTEIDLMTEAEFQADQERLKQEREEWLLNRERRALAHQKEGEAILADKMASRAFAVLPAEKRVNYWRSFQIRYPEVDVSAQIAEAVKSYQNELEELRSQQRIAELEARVAEAEKQAAAARLETEKLREETERAEQRQRYGLRYYTDPVIQDHRYFYRPPTVTIYSGNSGGTQVHRNNWIFRYGVKESPHKTAAE